MKDESDEQGLRIALVFIGDSDIARWPKRLLPLEIVVFSRLVTNLQVFDHAQSGAIMKDLPKQGRKGMKGMKEMKHVSRSRSVGGTNEKDANKKKNFDHVFFIACAGENDLSSGISIGPIIQSFEETVNMIFSKSEYPTNLIFLGPKIEPWMGGGEEDGQQEDDLDARKGYFNLSQHLGRKCETLKNSASISYIDCLKMFCEDTAHLPIVSNTKNKAMAQAEYFDADGLHLSDSGYLVWKGIVESIMEKHISMIYKK